MATYKLDLYSNAIDSLNEALLKYDQGLNGDSCAHKFVLLHFCHFMELVLKTYLWNKNENIIYSKVFREIQRESKKRNIHLFETYEILEEEYYDFSKLVINEDNPYTITADNALDFISSEGQLDEELIQEIRVIKN